EMIDQNDLAAGGAHAFELAHDSLRLRHDSHDVHGNHGVEAFVGKGESAGVHLVQPSDIVEIAPLDLGSGLGQHLGRKVYAGDGEMAAIAGQREPGADANLEHAAAPAIDDLHGMLAASLGDLAEGQVVDRSPAAIGIAYPGRVHYR